MDKMLLALWMRLDQNVLMKHQLQMEMRKLIPHCIPWETNPLKPSKSKMKFSGDQSYFKIDGKGQLAEVARMHIANPAAGTNGVTSIGIMSQSSKLATQDNAIHKKLGMLFPYEEFVKIFNCEVIDLKPRGLVNCGNSCYANAVLQCLTCTKPLIIFLLRRSHSRACCGIDWCLMCELEQHIGNGSQEDAHEFLRLLIASMQSICLEKLGGEDKVDPRLQETTFIHLTFGGRLRSKVKCLRCHHECAAYVRARKQLSIHEAPNILTIVFKEIPGGKIWENKQMYNFS
ncbi:hypothetical protein OIU84_002838 [Salix udensis]|uniref:USP domain-containing protein n=1 Tax=Salix udensis TaxID=889485 RepID=A0AAD6K538_9ROSI|nr:hypothetical protein OIU84_002838 [Salix udensis]